MSYLNSSQTDLSSPQPNLHRPGHGFPPEFWGLVVLTGIGAGLASAGLMELLHAVQHLAWPPGPGDFMAAVERAPAWQRVTVLAGAGLFAGVCRRMLRRPNAKGHAGDLSEAIWLKGGKIAVPSTLATALVSMIIVGMGASLGREGALKQAGAAIGAQLSSWRRLPSEQRRLLVACGAGGEWPRRIMCPSAALFSSWRFCWGRFLSRWYCRR